MPVQALRELFVDEVKDMYDAEHRLTQALPKLAKAAKSRELATAFEEHLKQTQVHITRLERVLDGLDEKLVRKTCKAMVGLLQEGDELMKMNGSPGVRDAALIAAAQKIEHYEIATYGCLRTWAHLLDEDEAKRLIQETLDEEGAADHRLTVIAESLPLSSTDDEEEHRERTLDREHTKLMEAESPSAGRAAGKGHRVRSKTLKH